MQEWKDRSVAKRGYLLDRFRMFYIKDQKEEIIDFHSHAFHKLVIFMKGTVVYNIEGVSYPLEPWDLLLIKEGEIHRPTIDPSQTYERLIIWIHEETLRQFSTDTEYLGRCFDEALERKTKRILLKDHRMLGIEELVKQLIKANQESAFGNELYKLALFQQLLVLINRLCLLPSHERQTSLKFQDPRISMLLEYINSHLAEDLTIDVLSKGFQLSRFYLMHQFKAQTGFTIHQYIVKKRLYKANALMRQGKKAAEASFEAGFIEYSSFLRAYKKQFKVSPRTFIKQDHIEHFEGFRE